MNVVLVFPDLRYFPIVPNLGLGYLAAYLSRLGHRVTIVHCGKNHFALPQLLARLRDLDPRVIGLQSLTHFHNKVVSYCQAIKRSFPGVITVVGGPHPSGVKSQLLVDEDSIDYGFCGESEIGFSRLLECLEGGEHAGIDSVPGLIWRQDGQIHANPIQVVQDLDSIPFPLWDQMRPADYPHHAHGYFPPGFPVAPLLMSRGCKYSCNYCSHRSISGGGIRYRSIGNVIEEVELLYRAFSVRNFAFVDQDILSSKRRTHELCARLESFPGLRWYCPNGIRLESIDEDTVRLMKQSGCYSVTIGIETPSPQMLRSMKKHTDLTILGEKLAILKKHGIRTTGNFMLGFPGDSAVEFLKTIAFSTSQPLDRAQFAMFTPFPGTDLYPSLHDGEGQMPRRSTDWSRYDVNQPNFVEDIPFWISKALLCLAFAAFYSRPGIFFRIVREIHSLSQLRYLSKRLRLLLSRQDISL